VGVAVRAQELAEEAEEARSRAQERERELAEVAKFREMFIGIVMHDLRNPLGAIGMAAEVLRSSGELEEKNERLVARILSSAERMSRMISQLLDLTRARLGGGFPLEPKATDLRDVCRRVVDEFSAHIELEIEGDLTGRWDQDRLEEALSNIVGNAIEHSTKGSTVSVRAGTDGAQVSVEIINRGSVIPADVLPFIFEPFRRGEGRRSSQSGHLGLGLYIAKQIVLAHGGTLDASSLDGKTSFVMRLPRGHRVCRPAASPAPDSLAL
jgi:signal transduction histidine kinase